MDKEDQRGPNARPAAVVGAPPVAAPAAAVAAPPKCTDSFLHLRKHFEGELTKVKASFNRVLAGAPEEREGAVRTIVATDAQPLKASLKGFLADLQAATAPAAKDEDYLAADAACTDSHEKSYLIRLLIAELDALVKGHLRA